MPVQQNNQVDVKSWKLAPHVEALKASIIREILKISSQPGVINFAGGLPAPELFPLEDMKLATADAIDKYGAACVQYSLSAGIPILRELIAKRATERGEATSMGNILLTSGAQQGIELMGRIFLAPGDYVLVENPTYLGALQAFNFYQARYATVEMDDEGMIIDQLEAQIKKYHPKLIYTVSNFQNPTGITMTKERRVALIEIAGKYGIPIVDDNPYGDIRFSGEPVPTLKSIGGDAVIVLRTFSKVMAPGIRLGWMNGPVPMLAQVEKVRQCADLHPNALVQHMVYEYVAAGKLEPHIEIIKANYRNKRDVMMETMRNEFPEEIKSPVPDGGMFLWCELPAHVSAKDLLPKAVELKVAYVYGEPFYPNGGGENTFRLNFSNAQPDAIVEGITRLGKLFKKHI